MLTCPVYIRNTGNVGLDTVSLNLPTAAGCTIGPLDPMAASRACNVSAVASQNDFDQGLMHLTVDGMAQPRTKSGMPFSWSQSPVAVQLLMIGRVSVAGAAHPATVTTAGELRVRQYTGQQSTTACSGGSRAQQRHVQHSAAWQGP